MEIPDRELEKLGVEKMEEFCIGQMKLANEELLVEDLKVPID